MTTPAEPPSPARVLAPLLLVPASRRHFRLPLSALEKAYGMTAPLVDELTALGLPRRETPDGPLFDENDIASLSLHLRLPSARRAVMAFWIRALRRLTSDGAPPAHRVDVTVGCPDPGHEGPCRYEADLGEGGAGGVFETGPEPQRILASLTLTASGRPRELPPLLRELCEEFREVDYYLLPGDAGADPDLLGRTGIADCILMAQALVDAARARGVEARLAGGLLVAVPFSSTHTWAECRVDGTWLPVDPLLPKALAAWGVPGAELWPPTLAPVGLFHRLGGAPLRPVTHGGTPCGASLRTREEVPA
ncbi:transglutaminase-like domain-containing protein [Streptomyces sp. NPDC085479]|uniref:transglutaminase-like domain-containing protein n=1 Tax=Streptomyces sp. NPDC085479 TaxID=3365726 RepID=UPI0037D1797F